LDPERGGRSMRRKIRKGIGMKGRKIQTMTGVKGRMEQKREQRGKALKQQSSKKEGIYAEDYGVVSWDLLPLN
jgi:hypothetical protein